MRRVLFAMLAAAVVTVAGVPDAGAVISPMHYARGTVIVQNDSYRDVAHSGSLNSRLAYIRTLGVPNLGLPQQGCIAGYPCITVTFADWGPTGWVGLTTSAWSCRGSALCSYVPHDPRTWTRVQINTYYGHTWVGWDATLCHELGHAIFQLNHAGGATCMEAAGDRYFTYSPLEVAQARAKFGALPK